MCFADGCSPPAPGGAEQPVELQSLVLGEEGTRFRAVHARPHQDARVGVVVLPDGRGLHPYYERLAHSLAGTGVEALAVDLYGRTAGVGPRGTDFDSRAHSVRLTWAGVQADLAAAVSELHRRVTRIAVFGFCLGGRIALLAATLPRLGLAAAVACYPQPGGPTRSDLPAPLDRVDALDCPTLTVFGGADELIAPAEVAAWRGAVTGHRLPHRVVEYAGAPHSFFDRAAGRYEAACRDVWRRSRALIEDGVV